MGFLNLEGVVAGIAGYGNSIGIPTVGGEIAFEPTYAANPLVNVFCLGIARHGDIIKGVASGAGNAVYSVSGCQPPPLDLDSDFTPVSSGQTVTGNLCFEIASKDAASLFLQSRRVDGLPGWFALR